MAVSAGILETNPAIRKSHFHLELKGLAAALCHKADAKASNRWDSAL